jgi:RimJ/RimL family protein N-acetyltransferase
VTLRAFRAEDLDEFAALMGDPAVRRYFPATLTCAEAAAMLARHMGHMAAHGFGFGALETPELRFAGTVGCGVVLKLWFAPAVEVGWLLRPEAWGRGYATEAATLALAHAFAVTSAPEIVAYTARANAPSQAVMRRLGMTFEDRDAFGHPAIATDHELHPHVLARLRRDAFIPPARVPADRLRSDG